MSAKAGALDARLAAILARHPDADAHLGEARQHAVANAVAEGRLTGGPLEFVEARSAGGQIVIVGGNDGGLAVVVAGVEDQGDGIPDPLVGLLRAEIVEDENFGGEDRFEELEFGGAHLGVVAVLNALEKLAVIAEEPANAAFADQPLEDADRKMGLADAHGAGEEEALAGSASRVLVDKAARGEQRFAKRWVGAVVDFERIEGAITITGGNLRGRETVVFTFQLLALTGPRNPLARCINHAYEPDAFANGANCHFGFKPSRIQA